MNEMKWTTEKPTDPGWYWYHPEFTETPLIVLVSIRGKSVTFERAGFSMLYKISKEGTGKWAGPIPVPEDE